MACGSNKEHTQLTAITSPMNHQLCRMDGLHTALPSTAKAPFLVFLG